MIPTESRAQSIYIFLVQIPSVELRTERTAKQPHKLLTFQPNPNLTPNRITADIMASRGLIKYLGIRNWNLVNVSSNGKFFLRTQQKCSDCGQLLGTTVVVASYKFKDFLSDNQGIREGYFLLHNLFSFSLDILLIRFYISLQQKYTY